MSERRKLIAVRVSPDWTLRFALSQNANVDVDLRDGMDYEVLQDRLRGAISDITVACVPHRRGAHDPIEGPRRVRKPRRTPR